ncbi:GNAT family N-acetyltransferase [Planococcus lenghuensis]|uniref:GNAT family N-acetyltransferase n=1 Tax=Planococcus lenghuensis TaxID=2213202 RepID=A0A1Q2KUB9_9BACL|nr:GNAT family N-acetyltransferase [Planococcus lenghuensis]AQQ51808.1 GNAT family N-acetyltransferase [Planococcus lenghuensis]
MYRSERYVFDGSRNIPVVIRNYTEQDFEDMIRIQRECFPPPFPQELLWNEEQLKNHVTLFPEGALCAEVDGRLAGSVTGLRVNFDPSHPDHTWEEITDDGYIRNHNPQGNTLYIVDISVSPAYRKLGLGKLLMQAMYHTIVELKLKQLLGGGRMPGYHEKAEEMSVEEYVLQVTAGELHDPVISFLLSCGRMPLHIVSNYLDDEESKNYGVLMEWKNPFR